MTENRMDLHYRNVPKRRAIVGRRILILIMMIGTCVCAAEAGVAIQQPPNQQQPWQAPADGLVDTSLLSASRDFYATGAADPRGCSYREITIPPYSSGYTILEAPNCREALHGWVIPGANAQGRRFAICWDGLIYPVRWIGAEADLSKDCRQMELIEDSHLEGSSHYISWPWIAPEILLHQRYFAPLKLAMLIRLNRTEEAAELITKLSQSDHDGHDELSMQNPFKSFVADWLHALAERAFAARSLGNDAMALSSLRDLIVHLRHVAPMLAAPRTDRHDIDPLEGLDYLDLDDSV